MIAGGVVLAAAGLWLVGVVLRHAAGALGYASFDDPAALPLVLLVLAAVGLLLAPVQNAISRHFERQCAGPHRTCTGVPVGVRQTGAAEQGGRRPAPAGGLDVRQPPADPRAAGDGLVRFQSELG
jgi:hypothetical protein